MARWKFDAARQARLNPTRAEKELWQALKGRQLMGMKFRRQHPVFGYIVDFYCAGGELAVEVDGGYHTDRKVYDQERDDNLAERGVTVIRFTNDEVLGDLPWVLESIAGAVPVERLAA